MVPKETTGVLFLELAKGEQTAALRKPYQHRKRAAKTILLGLSRKVGVKQGESREKRHKLMICELFLFLSFTLIHEIIEVMFRICSKSLSPWPIN